MQVKRNFRYLGRFDEELIQIKLKESIGQRKRNKQHANRENVINLTIKHEQEEYNICGIGNIFRWKFIERFCIDPFQKFRML